MRVVAAGLTKAYACGAPTPRALRPTALGAGAPNTGAYCFVDLPQTLARERSREAPFALLQGAFHARVERVEAVESDRLRRPRAAIAVMGEHAMGEREPPGVVERGRSLVEHP